MELKKLLSDAVSIESAITKIRNNENQGYIWIPVKGKGGCYFELGGRNYKGTLEFKAYIPRIENGKYIQHGNGWICSEYSIDEFFLEFPNKRVCLPKGFDFLDFIKTTNFKTYFPHIKEIETVKTEYSIEYNFKK